MNEEQTLEAALIHLETEGPHNALSTAIYAILDRARILAQRGHKNTLELELALARAVLA